MMTRLPTAFTAFRRAPLLSALEHHDDRLLAVRVRPVRARGAEHPQRAAADRGARGDPRVHRRQHADRADRRSPRTRSRSSPRCSRSMSSPQDAGARARAKRSSASSRTCSRPAFLPASLDVKLKPGNPRSGPRSPTSPITFTSIDFVDDVRFGEEWITQLYRLRNIAGVAGGRARSRVRGGRHHHHRRDDSNGGAGAEPRDLDHAARRRDRRVHSPALPHRRLDQGHPRRHAGARSSRTWRCGCSGSICTSRRPSSISAPRVARRVVRRADGACRQRRVGRPPPAEGYDGSAGVVAALRRTDAVLGARRVRQAQDATASARSATRSSASAASARQLERRAAELQIERARSGRGGHESQPSAPTPRRGSSKRSTPARDDQQRSRRRDARRGDRRSSELGARRNSAARAAGGHLQARPAVHDPGACCPRARSASWSRATSISTCSPLHDRALVTRVEQLHDQCHTRAEPSRRRCATPSR